MSIELPANLHRTADILRNSMMIHSSNTAPALPADLFEDLASRFAAPATAPAREVKVSFFEKARSFFSTPAFGMAGAALVILAVALPSVLNTSDSSGTANFRGNPINVEATASASIVLIGASEELVSSLGTSGDFEKGAILTADTASGAKVVVDFNSSTITAITAEGETVHSAALPADKADLSAAVAEALSKF